MKSLFKKLNWVQWIDILLLVLLTVFFAYLFWFFGNQYIANKQMFKLYGLNNHYAIVTYGKYLTFSIIAYIFLVALHVLFFARELKRH